MSDPPGFDDLVAGLRTLLDAEYRRGQADAARRIIDAAQAEVSPSSAPHLDRAGMPATTPLVLANGVRHRAPPGLPDALVTRVLMAQGSEGASSRLIEELAESDEEKRVSQSGIRFALDRGKAAGKYRNEKGKWFLQTQEEDEL